MASLRLTTYHRERIQKRAIEAAFAARTEALKASECAMGLAFYAVVFSEADLRAVAKVPAKWFSHDACLRFNVGGLNLRFGVAESVKVPASHGCAVLGSITDPAMIAEAKELFDKKSALKTEREAATRSLGALLESFGTLKRLEEAWPEGKPFFEDLATPPSNLPAPIIHDVNVMLGLAEKKAS